MKLLDCFIYIVVCLLPWNAVSLTEKFSEEIHIWRNYLLGKRLNILVKVFVVANMWILLFPDRHFCFERSLVQNLRVMANLVNLFSLAWQGVVITFGNKSHLIHWCTIDTLTVYIHVWMHCHSWVGSLDLIDVSCNQQRLLILGNRDYLYWAYALILSSAYIIRFLVSESE